VALTAANILLTLAVIGGVVLALWHVRAAEPSQRPPLAFGIAHGLIGVAGLAALLVALWGPPRAVAAGAGSFGGVAAWLLGAAVLLGGALLLRRRVAAVLIVLHAGVAICGWVLFLAWSSL
jgi:hypothetical protein